MSVILLILLATPVQQPAEFRSLRVLFTADIHARSQPTVDFESPGRPRRRLGGWAGLRRTIDSLRTPTTLLVDCGDFAFGSAESDSLQGRLVVQFMNRLGYDAAALGPRDFSGGLANVEFLATAAGFPLLADPMLNVALNRRAPLFSPYVLRKVGGMRVALIAVTGPLTAALNGRSGIRAIASSSAVEQVRRCLAFAQDDSADIVVVFGHIAVEAGLSVADSCPGVSMVLCCGPARADWPTGQTGTPVLASGEYGQRVGVVDIVYDQTTEKTQFFSFTLANVEPVAESTTNEPVLASSSDDFPSDSAGRLGLGLQVAEALRAFTRTSIAIVPLSSIESGIAAGPIGSYDAFGVVPYRDRVRIVEADDTILAGLLVTAGDSALPAPAVAGADLFVTSDTCYWPTVGSVARLRPRERRLGAYRVAVTEQWLAKLHSPPSGRLLEQDLTTVWLSWLRGAGALRSQQSVRLYPATPGVQRPAELGLVNINTADVELLCTLPGIGPRTAARIVEHRQSIGRFRTVEELMNVRGVGPKRFAQIRALICVR